MTPMMKPLVDLKLAAKDKNESLLGATPSDAPEAPEYPYGCCISLDEEILTKLGITAPPAVGSTMFLCALVKVESTRQYAEDGGEKGEPTTGFNVELQLTDMSLDTGKPDALYPSMRS
jgi:hypothetical protein